MDKNNNRKLIRATDLNAFILVDKEELGYIGVINLFLENGKNFTMYYIPLEIVSALNRMNGSEEEYVIRRESIFDLLPQLHILKESLSKILKSVIIDTIDESTGLYTATIELEFDTVTIQKRMIPSHAIFLARITGKPIFVSRDLVVENSEEKEK